MDSPYRKKPIPTAPCGFPYSPLAQCSPFKKGYREGGGIEAAPMFVTASVLFIVSNLFVNQCF